ncbi:MAG: hypothetical protein ACOCXZ_01760, partial [Chloroflexota bacterium]
GMGLGVRLETVGGQHTAWVGGDGSGYSTALWLAPGAATAVILLANIQQPAVLPLLARSIGLGTLGIDPEADQRAQAGPVDPALADRLTGYFAPSPGLLTNLEIWAAYGGGLAVRRRRDRLALSAQMAPSETRDLLPTDDPLAYRYRSAGGTPLVVFKTGPDGRAERLCIGLYELYRRPGHHSLGARLLMAAAALLVVFVLIVTLTLTA